jgi:hypothetical protein
MGKPSRRTRSIVEIKNLYCLYSKMCCFRETVRNEEWIKRYIVFLRPNTALHQMVPYLAGPGRVYKAAWHWVCVRCNNFGQILKLVQFSINHNQPDYQARGQIYPCLVWFGYFTLGLAPRGSSTRPHGKFCAAAMSCVNGQFGNSKKRTIWARPPAVTGDHSFQSTVSVQCLQSLMIR